MRVDLAAVVDREREKRIKIKQRHRVIPPTRCRRDAVSPGGGQGPRRTRRDPGRGL